ncbi:MAG: hypothetical protein ACK5Y2_09185 [Bdellovibrionales bacterium]
MKSVKKQRKLKVSRKKKPLAKIHPYALSKNQATKTFLEEIALLLRTWRKSQGLNIQDVCDQLGDVSEVELVLYETAGRPILARHFFALVRIYEVDVFHALTRLEKLRRHLIQSRKPLE